jgi:hypothetical protein
MSDDEVIGEEKEEDPIHEDEDHHFELLKHLSPGKTICFNDVLSEKTR